MTRPHCAGIDAIPGTGQRGRRARRKPKHPHLVRDRGWKRHRANRWRTAA